MRWRRVTSGFVAVGLAAATMTAAVTAVTTASASPSVGVVRGDPPNTLTKAAYQMSNGNSGTLDLAQPGGKAEVNGKEPIVVSVGDSYISGEGGRWAGNAAQPFWSDYADALGKTAYWDLNGAEAIFECHRSQSAEINFGKGVTSVNLACSGALTKTFADAKPFKPGMDFTDTTLTGGARAEGQALLLKNLALSNGRRIKQVQMSIGGNDFGFGDIVASCVQTYLFAGTPCSRLPENTKNFTDANIAKQRENIAQAFANVFRAMARAGYRPNEWTLVVQTYPSPVASSKTIRYGQNIGRQLIGGCGFYDTDLDWANDYALETINNTVRAALRDVAGMGQYKLLDLSDALLGHRLCEQNTTIVGPLWQWPWGKDWSKVRSWKQDNAVDLSEWVAQIRAGTNVAPEWFRPFDVRESLHPNYWAQLAYQNCLRQVYNGGDIRGGMCLYAGPGLKDGLPKMALVQLLGYGVEAEQPLLGRRGAVGIPGTVRKLKVRRRAATTYAGWKRPRDDDRVRAYFFRVRDGGRWGAWINAGLAKRVALLAKGPVKVKVTAMGHRGAGKPATARLQASRR